MNPGANDRTLGVNADDQTPAVSANDRTLRVLILDNYDSFGFNLYQLLGELGATPVVHRNDAIDLAGVRAMAPDAIVISPGPGRPDVPGWFGVCGQVISELGPSVPTLGVCLGHQGIVHAFGGRIVRAPKVMHGKKSLIRHTGDPLYAGLPEQFEAMRYHSLVADPAQLPGCLAATAHAPDGTIMGVRHRRHPVHGVQFHPESIGTTVGSRLLGNFLKLARGTGWQVGKPLLER